MQREARGERCCMQNTLKMRRRCICEMEGGRDRGGCAAGNGGRDGRGSHGVQSYQNLRGFGEIGWGRQAKCSLMRVICVTFAGGTLAKGDLARRRG